ncbi:MAG: ribonuclease P protein component [Candidatus Kerfeldbacteria bacterium]|nr:ribonuclease P protein component [Candidatus Kerfeldbacteria bacterium]
MLPRSRRLYTERQLRTVLRTGRTTRGQHLVIRWKANHLSRHRFGFIVGRRSARRAVDRNSLKRRLRHAASTVVAGPPHADVVVTVQPTAIAQPPHQLTEEFHRLCRYALRPTSRR